LIHSIRREAFSKREAFSPEWGFIFYRPEFHQKGGNPPMAVYLLVNVVIVVALGFIARVMWLKK
jgi:hypothetical protein